MPQEKARAMRMTFTDSPKKYTPPGSIEENAEVLYNLVKPSQPTKAVYNPVKFDLYNYRTDDGKINQERVLFFSNKMPDTLLCTAGTVLVELMDFVLFRSHKMQRIKQRADKTGSTNQTPENDTKYEDATECDQSGTAQSDLVDSNNDIQNKDQIQDEGVYESPSADNSNKEPEDPIVHEYQLSRAVLIDQASCTFFSLLTTTLLSILRPFTLEEYIGEEDGTQYVREGLYNDLGLYNGQIDSVIDCIRELVSDSITSAHDENDWTGYCISGEPIYLILGELFRHMPYADFKMAKLPACTHRIINTKAIKSGILKEEQDSTNSAIWNQFCKASRIANRFPDANEALDDIVNRIGKCKTEDDFSVLASDLEDRMGDFFGEKWKEIVTTSSMGTKDKISVYAFIISVSVAYSFSCTDIISCLPIEFQHGVEVQHFNEVLTKSDIHDTMMIGVYRDWLIKFCGERATIIELLVKIDCVDKLRDRLTVESNDEENEGYTTIPPIHQGIQTQAPLGNPEELENQSPPRPDHGKYASKKVQDLSWLIHGMILSIYKFKKVYLYGHYDHLLYFQIEQVDELIIDNSKAKKGELQVPIDVMTGLIKEFYSMPHPDGKTRLFVDNSTGIGKTNGKRKNGEMSCIGSDADGPISSDLNTVFIRGYCQHNGRLVCDSFIYLHCDESDEIIDYEFSSVESGHAVFLREYPQYREIDNISWAYCNDVIQSCTSLLENEKYSIVSTSEITRNNVQILDFFINIAENHYRTRVASGDMEPYGEDEPITICFYYRAPYSKNSQSPSVVPRSPSDNKKDFIEFDNMLYTLSLNLKHGKEGIPRFDVRLVYEKKDGPLFPLTGNTHVDQSSASLTLFYGMASPRTVTTSNIQAIYIPIPSQSNNNNNKNTK